MWSWVKKLLNFPKNLMEDKQLRQENDVLIRENLDLLDENQQLLDENSKLKQDYSNLLNVINDLLEKLISKASDAKLLENFRSRLLLAEIESIVQEYTLILSKFYGFRKGTKRS